jgi:signal transduction histidine kinase
MAAFGALVSALPLKLVQPAIVLSLGLCNTIALILLIQRAREPGPEQRGWRLLALSIAGVLASNLLMVFTPTPMAQVSGMEILYFGILVLVAALQAWAVLSWPLRSSTHRHHRLMSLLGSFLFASSLFLLIWTAALWQVLDQGQEATFFRMTILSVRMALVGGVTSYFLADDPRRIAGPLGWIFLAAVALAAIIFLARPYLYDQNSVMQPSPLFGLVLGIPIILGLAAWSRVPVEVPPEKSPLRFPMVEGLLYLPFIAVGAGLFHSALRHRDYLLPQIFGFLGVSVLLLVRQFLLLREVQRANEQLEIRVADRTRSLEELQGLLLRTERLNSVGALGAGLAHDLNNALAGIRGYTQLARMRLEEDNLPPTAEDLDRILVAADQSAALTGRLMAFARQEEEGHGPLDLAAETSNLESLLRMMLTYRVALNMDLGNGPAPIYASRNHLEQILVNLVGNARDAMPEGGIISLKIRVESKAVPPVVSLEISDTGSGMTPDIQARIFQPFFTTKAHGKGTGLGLASVKHLVGHANGTIQVQSQPGLGSRFILRFPLLT